ncbi:MAG: endo-1,4-beta-xylanase [Phycisphaeraceae bacterium]
MDAWRRAYDALAPRIDDGIERHRKSDVTLRLEDAGGKPLSGTRVAVDQVASDFLFGANIFMLGGYATEALNARYEQAFVGLFNAATVPFYWRDLEPTPGQLRFAADSVPIPRRPPPDAVVAFCEQHGLNMNGHCLVWDFVKWSVPDWVPDDPAQSAPLWEQRIGQIAARYGKRIPRWDVLNESLDTPPRLAKGLSRPMPENYERLAFAWAQRHLPAGAFLMINETTSAWTTGTERYVQLIRRLREVGARINGVGMQIHLFGEAEFARLLAGQLLGPQQFLTALDKLGALDLPIHISEITLPAPGNDQAGQAAQARVARDLYRLWFSHPAVHAITWWNVPDGGAAPGEDKIASGLLTRELEPKPAYTALHELIHHDWRTRLTATTDASGEVHFRGFHGQYRLAVAGVSHAIHVSPGDANLHRISLQESRSRA